MGLFLIVVGFPIERLLSLLADHAPAQTSADLRQFGVMSLLGFVAGIVLCVKGLASRRERPHWTVCGLGLTVAVVWVAVMVAANVA